MVVAFPQPVLDRLGAIEADEGVPAVELVHQAVAVWSHLDGAERRTLGLAAAHLVARRPR